MATSLEKACEDFFIALLKLDSRLSGKPILHFEEEDKAPTKAIVIRVVQGNHNLAGPGGYDLEASIEYRAGGKTSKVENDAVAAAINQVVYERSVVNQAGLETLRAAAGLAFIVIKDESSGDRQNTNDLRKRSITLSIQARLA